MKKKIHYVFFLITLITFHLQTKGQILPLVCGGSQVRYGVTGMPKSVFHWEITGGKINTYYNDSIDVTWNSNTITGILTITEHTYYGCEVPAFSITVNIDNPSITFISPVSICNGKTAAIAAPDIFSTYQWNTGSSNSAITATDQGWYRLKATDTKGCSATDSVYLSLLNNPSVNLGKDTSLCQDFLILDAGNDGLNFKWSTGEISNTIKVFKAYTDQMVWVQVESESGCLATDTLKIMACNLTRDPSPNTFTPNGDGWNDTWIVDRFVSNDIEIQIFDRWGINVFHAKTGLPAEGWNGIYKGQVLPTDSYYYIIKYNDGSNKTEKGNITIIH